MSLIKSKPFGDLFSLHDRITRMFEDEYSKDPEKNPASLATWYPVTDIYETKEEYNFKLEVPGLKKEDISIEFCDGILSIKGERKEEREIQKENYLRVERFTGAFNRSFSLPRGANTDKIEASIKDGILELRIPKAEERKAKSIAINS